MRILLAFPPGTASINAWPAIIRIVAGHENVSAGLLEFREPFDQAVAPRVGLEFVMGLGVRELLDLQIGEQASAAYTDFVLSTEYQNFRFVALKMLNRLDLSGTFRFLDREVFLQAAILGTLEVIQTRRPDLIVFPVTPHEFLPFVLHRVARFANVQVLFFQPSPMAFTLIPKTGLDSPVRVPEGRDLTVDACNNEVLLRSFRRLVDGMGPGYMALQVERDRQVAKFWARVRAVQMSMLWLFTDRFPNSLDLTGHKSVPGFLSRPFKMMAARSLIASLRERALSIGGPEKPSGPYVVVALHYEPERTSLPEGLPVDFQADLVPKALKLFPPETNVFVKEHYSQQTSALRGFAGRSPLFYDLLVNLPRTFLINPTEPLGPIIQDAECVITLGGTVALEAVLRGVPVGYYGSPWWAGLPGTIRLTGNSVLDDIVGVALPDEDEVLEFLLDLQQSSMIPGIGGEKIATTEKKIGPIPAGLVAAEAEAVSQLILNFCSHNEIGPITQ